MSIAEEGKGQKPEWKAPRREHGGEDLQEYFAVSLAKEIVANLFSEGLFRKKIPVETLLQLPLIQVDLVEMDGYHDGVESRLKEKGLYFYGEGSVFADFKISRDRAHLRLGEGLGETDPERAKEQGALFFSNQFNLNTPKDELLAKARDFVKTWEWSE